MLSLVSNVQFAWVWNCDSNQNAVSRAVFSRSLDFRPGFFLHFRSGKRSIIELKPPKFEKLLIFRSKFREIQIFRLAKSGHTLAVQGDLQFA